MKTGVIVYVAGENPVGEDLDIGAEVRRLQPDADRVELVSRNAGHFDIEEAWWVLTTKGMQRIFCMMGIINAKGGLQLKEGAIRLCG